MGLAFVDIDDVERKLQKRSAHTHTDLHTMPPEKQPEVCADIALVIALDAKGCHPLGVRLPSLSSVVASS